MHVLSSLGKSSKMKFNRVTVIGAGQMGHGIAQVIAQTQRSVHLVDINKESLSKARQKISSSLATLHHKKKIPHSPTTVLKKIHFTQDIEVVKKSDLVIEAVPECLDTKRQILHKLSKMVGKTTVIATNTSSISITTLARAFVRSERVAGLHFMNPVPLLKLVEVIKAIQTSCKIFEQLKLFVGDLGKTAVVSQDQPGFIVNRILMPMINEAITMLQESTASAEEIDRAMQLGCHYPMGPLALADFIGLDTCLSIMEVLKNNLGDKYHPCPLLKRHVAAGHLGRKSKKGFYTYT